MNVLDSPPAASRRRAARAAVLLLGILGILIAAAPVASAAPPGRPGALDPSFAGGSVIRGFGTVAGEGGAVESAPMPDGGFLVRTGSGSIGRYLADGSRDRGFGIDGYLIGSGAYRIATTAGGRVYVLAWGPGEGRRLSRLLPDGSPDPSFGRRGSVELGPHLPPLETMLVAPSGAVFLAGTDFDGGGGAAVDALRVAPDGRIDTGYGRDGVARTRWMKTGTGQQFLYALDGESLTFVANAGQFSKGNASWRNLLLGRFDPRGDVVPSFSGKLRLPGDALEESLTGIATGPGGEVLVIAQEHFIRLSAQGALEPGAPSGEAAVGELRRGTSFSSFAIQPDGKIVIGGRTVGEGPSRLVLARLDPDGSLDRTFGGGSGVATAGIVVGEGTPALSVLADGDLLLSGETGEGAPLLGAARFTADGAPDPRFGSGGELVVAPVAYSDDKVNAILPAPDGGVLATGTARGRVLVTEYRPDGRPDRAFGDRGLFLADAAEGAAEQGTALARLPGGRIVVGTRSRAGASLIMLGSSGRPIRSFGQDGTIALGDFDQVSSLAVSRSGAILVAGSLREPCRYLVERVGPGGAVDRGFGTSGGATQIGRWCGSGDAAHMVERPGGNLLVAINGSRSIVELTASGRRDKRFSTAGEALPKHLSTIALDPRGRLLVGGTLFHRLGLVRLERDGTLDRAFGRGGFATREVGREATATALAIEPDGKILAAGSAMACPPSYCGGPTAVIARFDPDGTIDPGFGRRGVWTGRRETSALDSLAPAGGGALFAGGWSTVAGDRNLLLVKVRR